LSTLSQYLESVLAWSRPQTKFIILVHCIKQTPADCLKQVETLFTPHFDILSYEYRANVCLGARSDYDGVPIDPLPSNRVRAAFVAAIDRTIGSSDSMIKIA
jgi:hypothetical protein